MRWVAETADFRSEIGDLFHVRASDSEFPPPGGRKNLPPSTHCGGGSCGKPHERGRNSGRIPAQNRMSQAYYLCLKTRFPRCVCECSKPFSVETGVSNARPFTQIPVGRCHVSPHAGCRCDLRRYRDGGLGHVCRLRHRVARGNGPSETAAVRPQAPASGSPAGRSRPPARPLGLRHGEWHAWRAGAAGTAGGERPFRNVSELDSAKRLGACRPAAKRRPTFAGSPQREAG
jgi:hypothetical protein